MRHAARAVLLLGALLASPSAARATGFTLIDLGTPASSAPSSAALGIDDTGRIVGFGGVDVPGLGTADRGLVWSTSTPGAGPLRVLAPPAGGTNAIAFGSNGAGPIVGNEETSPNGHALSWAGTGPSGTPTPLAYAGTGTLAEAAAVNAQGVIVGDGTIDGSGAFHALAWTAGQPGVTILPGLAGGSSSAAYGVNASGTIVGDAVDAGGLQHAAVWSSSLAATAPTALDLLPGGASAFAFGVNAAGAVVGQGDFGFGLNHALYWAPGTTTPIDLEPMVPDGLGGFVPLGGNSSAVSINSAGWIVGSADVGTSTTDAFLWHVNGDGSFTSEDLGSFGAGSQAAAINSLGEIVGSGGVNGETHALLWEPSAAVPEPGAIALAALAAAALVTRRRL